MNYSKLPLELESKNINLEMRRTTFTLTILRENIIRIFQVQVMNNYT